MQVDGKFLNNINSSFIQMQKKLASIASASALSQEDPASRSIYDQLQIDSSSLAQGIKNSNDAIGVLSIADGAASSLSDTTNKLNVLSVAYNNPALGSNGRDALMQESSALKDSMKQTVEGATFNGKNVFGSLSLGSGGSTSGIDALDITNQSTISSFADSLSSLRVEIGSSTNALASSINAQMAQVLSLSAASSQIGDTDMASAASGLNQSLLLSNAALFAQSHNTQKMSSSVSELLG